VAEHLSRQDLRAIAGYQKAVLVCILVYLALVASQFFLPVEMRTLLVASVIVLGVVGTVFVFLLATKVYNPGLGVMLGILTLIPCIGLIPLLVVNGKATSVLKEHGVRVGLLGARSSDIG
jgi:hypothetical protein